MRRLALLAGILGALTGLFFGYNKVQIMWRAHVQHSRFEVLMGRPAIQPVALLAKERWRYRNPHRYYSRWQYIEINDDTREIEGVTVDNTNGSISEFSLFSGEDVRDDTDRPFYAYFVIVLYPLIGFAIPWLGIRGIALVSAGVSKQK